jgi:hypothetical protein
LTAWSVLPLLILLSCLSGLAFSLDSPAHGPNVGPTVGLALVPARHATVLNAQLAWPLLDWQLSGELLHLSLRGDASFTTGRVPPAFGLALVLAGREAADTRIEPYLGFGAGLAFLPAPLPGPDWSLYGLTGLRVGNPQGAAAILELQLAGNRQVLVPSVSLGFSWRFGSAR